MQNMAKGALLGYKGNRKGTCPLALAVPFNTSNITL